MGVGKDRIEYFGAVISYLKNPPGYGIIPNASKEVQTEEV